jgi:hypothetical protein
MFTIRDLLWLIALIAMGLGWWLDHRKNYQRWEIDFGPEPGDKIMLRDKESPIQRFYELRAKYDR